MAYQLIIEQVDLHELPDVDPVYFAQPGVEITLGDLHANTLKLLFMLIKHGIASNINQQQYDILRLIILQPVDTLQAADVHEFNAILEQMQFNPGASIRLIGDELADRMSCDYFTLKIFEKLQQQQVRVTTLVSNHGIEFIKAYETRQKFKAVTLETRHAQSLKNLNTMVVAGLVTREEVLALVDAAYKPTLKVIDYLLSEDHQEISLFSHAGIGLNTIKNIAASLGVTYADESALDLATTIDQINLQFRAYVQDNRVHTLFPDYDMFEGYSGEKDLSAKPLAFLIWNRFYHVINRPAKHHGYSVNYVHGHDADGDTTDHICNLDNILGKSKQLHRGTYSALYALRFLVFTPGEFLRKVVPAELALISHLQTMRIKAQQLREHLHFTAAKSAEILYGSLRSKIKNFINRIQQNAAVRHNFVVDCTRDIDAARPELERHGDWKQVLGNLGKAIGLLGVGYVLAGHINRRYSGRFLLFKTESAGTCQTPEQQMPQMMKRSTELKQ